MKVAFISSEVFPFAKTGGLADVAGVLPLALEKLGVGVVVFLPHYSAIKGVSLERINKEVSKTEIGSNVDVFFIEHDKFFNREGLYGDKQGDFKDNLDRFAYFCQQSLKFLKELHPDTNIVHCHDWPSALVPVYLKEKFKNDPFYSSLKSILTIHNLAFQGIFKKEELHKTGLREDLFSSHGFEFYGQMNLLKAGILYADRISTVSPQYAKEILTQRYGCGLDGLLRSRRDEVAGILNGIDYDIWNPEADPYIVQKFSTKNDRALKAKNKSALQEKLNFKQLENVPLIGFVGRLSHQKGIDLILECIDELAHWDVQLVIQGIGEEKYHALLNKIAAKYSSNVAVKLEFEESLAHLIYAGTDMFLMPSLYEPCGLSQMIALRYGSAPIVYKTGGLADTIHPFNKNYKTGNGFLFEQYDKNAFLNSVKEAVEVYKRKEKWQQLVLNALASDYSWQKSAQQYKELYQWLLSG